MNLIISKKRRGRITDGMAGKNGTNGCAEGHDLLTGAGCFAGDAVLDDPLHVAFVRSNVAAGRLAGLDLGAARAAPGVFAVHSGADVAGLGVLSVNLVLPISQMPEFRVLSRGEVRALGDPIAAVLADSAAHAVESASLIDPEIEESTAQRHEIARQRWLLGDVEARFAEAAHVVQCRVTHPRLVPNPMEPRTISVAYDRETDRATIWHASQTPHRTRSELAAILGVDPARLRVVARHVGGAFGMKASLYPEDVFVVWAAFQHRRSVRWTATRSEDFLSATHGRGLTCHGELALDDSGRFLALQARIEAPLGSWLPNSALIPAWNAGRILPCGYRVEALDITTCAVQDGRGPTGIYRGAGRPEANMLMERLADKAARVTGLKPIEVRKRNLLKAENMPYRTATGNVLDSGDYPAALASLADIHDDLIRIRDTRRAEGGLMGVGIGFYLEPSGSGWESARVTQHADGTVTVFSGSSCQGQGRQTAYARIAGEALGIAPHDVQVVLADTETTPPGIGALASRSTAIGGSAVLKACQMLQAKRHDGATLPVTSETVYDTQGQAWGYGAYVAMISICEDTGKPTVETLSCIDDAGRLICPALAHGQILGGAAQGVGEALMEQAIYDADGQLLSGSLMDYALPRARDIPPLTIRSLQTSSPMNLLGAKGLGEAGTIGAPIAILNAALDALAPVGIRDLDMPLTACKLWHAIHDAKRDADQKEAP